MGGLVMTFHDIMSDVSTLNTVNFHTAGLRCGLSILPEPRSSQSKRGTARCTDDAQLVCRQSEVTACAADKVKFNECCVFSSYTLQVLTGQVSTGSSYTVPTGTGSQVKEARRYKLHNGEIPSGCCCL